MSALETVSTGEKQNNTTRHQPDHRLSLPVQLEQEMSGRVQTCAVPLLSFDDAGLTGLPGLRLDGDDHLVIILAKTTLTQIILF